MPTTFEQFLRFPELDQETLLDPVSKFRVSMPQAMIDTDFEYSLQPTKWETLELVNNTPSFFYRSGDTGIAVSDVRATFESYFVEVYTVSAHNLLVSSPFIIQGLTSPTAEGSFVVLAVLSSNSFVYRTKARQLVTGSIYDTYTTSLFAGQYYEGCQYRAGNIESITTNEGNPSQITVTTTAPHGFAASTSMILTNTLGRKYINIDATQVDFADTLSGGACNILTTPETNPLASGLNTTTVNPYVWESKKTVTFGPTNVNTTNNTITITNHGLLSNSLVMYCAPPLDSVIGGLSNHQIYVAKVIDQNTVSLMELGGYADGFRYNLDYGRNTYLGSDHRNFYNLGLNPFAQSGKVLQMENLGFTGNPLNNSWNNFHIEFFGYFRPPTTGTWTFYMTSDDFGNMWIGANAMAYRNAAYAQNMFLNTTNGSATISLNANELYPIRIHMGESTGNDNLKVEFSGPGVNRTSDFTGYLFSGEFFPYTSNVIPLTSAGTNNYGLHALMKAYQVNNIDTIAGNYVWPEYTTSNNTGALLAVNDEVQLVYSKHEAFTLLPPYGLTGASSVVTGTNADGVYIVQESVGNAAGANGAVNAFARNMNNNFWNSYSTAFAGGAWIATTSNVRYWGDLSGKARDVSLIYTNIPVFYAHNTMNGLPTIAFDGGVNRILRHTGIANVDSSEFTLSCVVKPLAKSAGVNGYIFATTNNSTGGVRVHFRDNLLRVIVVNGIGDEYNTGYYGSNNVPILLSLSYSYSANSLTVRVDGNVQSTYSYPAIPTVNMPLTSINIGSWTNDGNGTLNGNLSEIILYNQLLSTSNIERLEGYLANKWWAQGLNTLPSNHPYKNASPTNWTPLSPNGIINWFDANKEVIGNFTKTQANPVSQGEWIQIKLPRKVRLCRYQMSAWGGTFFPKTWNVLGYNDGDEYWTIVDTRTNSLAASDYHAYAFDLFGPTSKAYQYYRIHVTSVVSNSSVQLDEILLWGLVENQYTYNNGISYTANPLVSSRYYITYAETNYGTRYTRLLLSATKGGSKVVPVNQWVSGNTFLVPSNTLSYGSSIYYPNHGYSTGQTVNYYVTSGSGPSGLTDNSSYKIEKITNDYFRLSSMTYPYNTIALGSVGNGSIAFTKSGSNTFKNTIYAPLHDLYNTMQVTYSNMGNPSIPGLSNNTSYYVINVTGDKFKLASSSVPSIYDNEIDLTGSSTGVHQFSVASSMRPVDGSYAISSVPSTNTFILDSPYQVLYASTTFTAGAVKTYTSNIFIPDHTFRTGTLVTLNAISLNSNIGNAIMNTDYYAMRIDNNHVALVTSLSGIATCNMLYLGDTIVGDGSSIYELKPKSIVGDTYGVGTISLTAGSRIITGANGTNFTTNFKLNDTIDIAVPPIVASLYISSIDTANNTVILTTPHNIATGDIVNYVNNGGTALAPLTFGSAYFVRNLGYRVLAFYFTYSDAIGNTNRIIFTNTATGGIFRTSVGRYIPSSVNSSTAQIAMQDLHNFVNGNAVFYTVTGGTPISPLTSGSCYYVRAVSTQNVTLHTRYSDAINNLNAVAVTSMGSGNSVFTFADQGYMLSSPITSMSSSTTLEIRDAPIVSLQGAKYYVSSAVYPKMDGIVNHKPVDGCIELIPSNSPYAQIIRQTRRYFRYQSGKGIQISFAVNFSPPVAIEFLTKTTINGSLFGLAKTKKAHRLSQGVAITIEGASNPSSGDTWNGGYIVYDTPEATMFRFNLGSKNPGDVVAQGFPTFIVSNWTNSCIRSGMFDDQNGLFIEYDGTNLYAVRRNSVMQLPGLCTVTANNSLVSGTNTLFTSQLSTNSMVVIKGQSYKVTSVVNNTTFYIQPPYRGISNTNVVISKTVDLRVPSTQWSIDHCDGTGPSGYVLDVHKIQMCYIDYSWYGAGKVRFGFKDGSGDVRYVHEFIHNNIMTEAYLRSGNLPCRFEVYNTGTPLYVPSLSHWGTSVIMDGRFDDDKAYLFTANGNILAFTNDAPLSFNAVVTPGLIYLSATNIYTTVQYIRVGSIILSMESGIIQTESKVVRIERIGNTGNIYLDKMPLVTTQSTRTFYVGSTTTDALPALIPLVSVRLAPSVDNGRVGALGSRDIINRMQLNLKSIDALVSHDTEIKLILNGRPSNRNWVRATNPSLAQMILHGKNETVEGGIVIYSFRATGGFPDSTNKRTCVLTTQFLGDILALGNSIMGGDEIYPDGPDIITVCATCIDFNGISNTNLCTIGARISWSESQA